jgi:hypothetical protein
MYDLYLANQRDTCRFILGRSGSRPLLVVGLNPSTANRDKSDITATKVERVAQAEDYRGFVMTNLYPLRTTLPDNLPRRSDRHLLRRNVDLIIEQARQQEAPHFWAAWGADINKRGYLVSACKRLADEVANINGSWWCFGPVSDKSSTGNVLTKAGHPRHPSRLSYAWALQRFDMSAYVAKLG